MQHWEEPQRPPAILPIPWRDTVGLCSLSPSIEVLYDSLEEYEEEAPRALTLSPATMKLHAAESEKYMEEMSSWSDEYDLTGKTPQQLDALIAKYHSDVKASLMEANWSRALEGM
jgi:hypothetical protein